MRLRVSGHLDRWLAKLAPELERQRASEALSDAGREDYLRELKLIGFGHDPDARPADRLKALLELLRLEDQALTTTAWQREPHSKLAEIEAEIAAMDEAELRRAKSGEE